MADFYNDKSNTLISGTSGNDSINNWYGSNVTIDGGEGADTIHNYYISDVSIIGGTGNDYINNEYGSNVTINSGAGDDFIYNNNASVTIDGGTGNDDINTQNGNVSINGGAGNEYLYISNGVTESTVIGGAGADTIVTWGAAYITIEGGTGNDSILNGNGDNTTIQFLDTGEVINGGDYILFKYNLGDGNDIINGFNETSTLSISGSSYSTTKSGKNIIVTVGTGKISLIGAASLSAVNIVGDETLPETNSWKRSGTTATYGTSSKTLATVKGVKNLDGLSVKNKVITLKNSALNKKVTVSGSYEFDFASDYKNATITGSSAADTIAALGKNILINGGKGADVFVYKGGTNIIKDYAEEDTISLSSGTANISVSGDDIIITVGKGKISLIGAASLSAVNIVGDETLPETNSWKLSGTTATYGTSSKTLVTVEGVKSLDGLSINKKVVTVSKASLGTSKVTISDGYTLKLGSDVKAPTTKKAAWSFKNSTATYKSSYKTAGYTLANNAITYSKATTAKTLVTVKGVKSLDGLSLSKKVVTVSKASLGTDKVTISDGYTLKLGSDVDKPTTKKAAWTLKSSTATYKSSYKTAGYTLKNNVISYTKATTAATLATVKGAKSKSGISVSKKVITLKNSALNKKVTVSGAYEFDFASDYKNATITGSTSNDTITARGSKILVKGGKGADTIKTLGSGTVSGGDGKDIFYFKSGGANVISDYAAEDKISLASGTANISASGDDVIFTVGKEKITVQNGADKKITYIENDTEKIYQQKTSEVVQFNDAGTGVTLSADYTEDTFDLADYVEYKNTVVTIDASAVTNPLEITGNSKSNIITGTNEDDFIDGGKAADKILGKNGNDTLNGGAGNDSLNGGADDDYLLGNAGSDTLLGENGNDSLWGGAGDDTLYGGAGHDIFIYKKGDGRDVIEDFANIDRIIVSATSSDIKTPFADNAGDVTFNIGSGQIIIKGGADKTIQLYDENGSALGKKYTPSD